MKGAWTLLSGRACPQRWRWLVTIGSLLFVLLVSACGTSSRPGLAVPPVAATLPPASSPETPSAASIAGQTLAFRRLTLDDGLSQSSINCIAQDAQGFMWFGTQDGLNRYDGYEFQVYRNDPADPFSLSSNSVWVASVTSVDSCGS